MAGPRNSQVVVAASRELEKSGSKVNASICIYVQKNNAHAHFCGSGTLQVNKTNGGTRTRHSSHHTSLCERGRHDPRSFISHLVVGVKSIEGLRIQELWIAAVLPGTVR